MAVAAFVTGTPATLHPLASAVSPSEKGAANPGAVPRAAAPRDEHWTCSVGVAGATAATLALARGSSDSKSARRHRRHARQHGGEAALLKAKLTGKFLGEPDRWHSLLGPSRGGGAGDQGRARLAALRAQPEEAGGLSEAEQMFKEAFESEQERGQLLKTQLEAALTEKLGSGTKISIDAIEVRTPQEAGGTTWRDAYEAAKKRTDDLEQQLVKARGMGQQQPAPATAPGPAPGPAPAVDPAVAVGTQPPAQEAEPVSTSFQSAGTDDQMEQVRRLQEVSNFAAEEEAVLRLIAVAVLPNRGLIFSPEDNRTTTSLQPVAQVREAIGDSDYRVQETIVFERCYVFKGSPVPGKSNAEALENVRARVRGVSAANATELFLQPTKDGQSMILMLLEEDLPEKEVPAWNWAIAIFLLLATLVAANSTTLAVVPVSQSMINNADPDAMLRVASKLFPTAAGILTTVGASELARRATAGAYGVQLSPPFFIPAWPFPSVGCLAAISRRLTPVPSKESELAISAAAASTGLAVSLAFMVYGLALGPDTDLPINLNFQLLPALLKLLLKPLLGTASVSDQPDPFLDPVSIAFPANPYLIGGICGLIITSLSLLPVGRLDGGVLARSAIGSGASGIVGFLGLGLLAVGSFSPGDDGTLYLSFGVASLIWQSGSELPAREAVSEAPDGYKALAVILLVLGFLLCIPGAALPNI